MVRALRQSQRALANSPTTTPAATSTVIQGCGALPVRTDATTVTSTATSRTTTSKKAKTPRRKRRPAPNPGPRRPAHGGAPSQAEPRQAGRCPCCSGIGEPVPDPVHRQHVARPTHLGLDLAAHVLHRSEERRVGKEWRSR